MSTDIIVMPESDRFMPVMAIATAKQRYNALVSFTKDIMTPGKDFGAVPGTDKPTLLKPGAEKLMSFFGLTVEDPEFITKDEDWTGERHGGEACFYYMVRQRVTRNGTLIASQVGSCNSWESKYRYRWVKESDIPAELDKKRLRVRDGSITEFAFAIDKAETSGPYGKPAEYWQAFKTAIQGGTARHDERKTKTGKLLPAWTIGAPLYRVPNTDVFDVINTVQKMACKRALVAVTLIACNASEFFHQDLDDIPELVDVPAWAPTPVATAPQSATPHTVTGGATLADVTGARPTASPPPAEHAGNSGQADPAVNQEPPPQADAEQQQVATDESMAELGTSISAITTVASCQEWRKEILPTLSATQQKAALRMLLSRQISLETSIVACAKIANEMPELKELAGKRQDAIRSGRQSVNTGGQR